MTEHTDKPPAEEPAEWAARGIRAAGVLNGDLAPKAAAENLIALVRREAFREAAAKLRDAAEQGYRPNTARYTHYREAADMIEGMAGQ